MQAVSEERPIEVVAVRWETVHDFASRHFAHLDAGSTDRVIDQLILAR